MLDLTSLITKKVYNAQSYWNELKALLPKGFIWRPEMFDEPIQWQDNPLNGSFTHEDSAATGEIIQDVVWGTGAQGNDVFADLLMAFAQELDRLDDSLVDLQNEAIPGLSTQLLTDWEGVAGLPDECTPLAPTIEERRVRVHLHITQNKGDQSLTEWTQHANYFIQYASTMGYTIVVTEPLSGEIFRVGVSRVGDRLQGMNYAYTWIIEGDYDSTLQCIFNKIKPAHTEIWWA